MTGALTSPRARALCDEGLLSIYNCFSLLLKTSLEISQICLRCVLVKTEISGKILGEDRPVTNFSASQPPHSGPHYKFILALRGYKKKGTITQHFSDGVLCGSLVLGPSNCSQGISVLSVSWLVQTWRAVSQYEPWLCIKRMSHSPVMTSGEVLALGGLQRRYEPVC